MIFVERKSPGSRDPTAFLGAERCLFEKSLGGLWPGGQRPPSGGGTKGEVRPPGLGIAAVLRAGANLAKPPA